MRTQEEIQSYADRVMTWVGAILGVYTSPGEPRTEEDIEKLDREMMAIPARAKNTLNQLHLQLDVLAWVLGGEPELVGNTREKVDEAGVDLYQLEDAYRGEPESD
jgi:hypothetical protein